MTSGADFQVTFWGVRGSYPVPGESTARFGGNISYFFTKYFSLELSAEYSQKDMTEYPGGVSNYFGEFEQIPILLNARLHPPVGGIVKPYIGLGGGYNINNLDFNAASSSALDTLTSAATNVEFENTWGIHINGGIKVDLTENITLDVDLRYGWSNPDAIIYYANGSVGRSDIDIRDFVGGIGITYYFK